MAGVETQHILSPFITTGPDTDSASPGDIKLFNRLGPVFVDHSKSNYSLM